MSLGLRNLGMFLPVIPPTPSLLLTGWGRQKDSPRLHDRLMSRTKPWDFQSTDASPAR